MKLHPLWRSTLPLFAAALVACGAPPPEEEPTPSAEPEIGIVALEEVSLPPGGEVSLAVSLTRNETATGEVSLSVDGLPAGVTATFDPASLSGTTLETTLVLAATRDAEEAQVAVTLQATGPEGLTATHPLTLSLEGLTVHGTVHAHFNAAPAADMEVRVDDAWVRTDAEGRFTAEGVRVPYELELSYVGYGNQHFTELYEGLTTPTPHVVGLGMLPVPAATPVAILQGTVSPIPASGEGIAVCLREAVSSPEGCVHVPSWEGTFQLQVPGVSAEATKEVKLVARHYSVNTETRTVTDFIGYAETTVSLTGGTSTEVALALEPEPTASRRVAFTIESPVDPSSLVAMTYVTFGDHLALQQVLDDNARNVLVPATGAAYIFISAPLPDGGSTVMLRPADGSPAQLLAPPTLVSPEAGAPITADTEFVATLASAGMASHFFRALDGRILVVHSDRTPFTLPVLESGAGIAPSELELWSVVHTPSASSTDALLQEAQLFPYVLQVQLRRPVPVPNQALSFSSSASRQFNTPGPTGATVAPATLLQRLTR